MASSRFTLTTVLLYFRDHHPQNPVPEPHHVITMKLAQGITVITNGQLVDGHGNTPVDDAVVHLQDGLITYAGPSQEAP